MRLSIFNSSWHLLAAVLVVTLLGLCAMELAERSAGIPYYEDEEPVYGVARANPVLILGDSRADAGLAPPPLEQTIGCGTAGNMATEGTSPINQLELLKLMNLTPKMALVAVSPASFYGTFYKDPAAVKKKYLQDQRGPDPSDWLKYPYRFAEDAFSDFVDGHLKLANGFRAFRAVITRTPLPELRGPDGWDQIQPVGERLTFTRLVNVKAYKSLVLESKPEVLDQRDQAFKRAVRALGPKVRTVLVRLPCSPELRKIEDARFPDFDRRMDALAAKLGATYLPEAPGFTPDWSMTDGSHLLRTDALEFSRAVGQTIADRGLGCAGGK